MKNRNVCLITASLLTLVLLLASCGTPEATTAPANTAAGTTAAGTITPMATTKPAAEKPKYGGIFVAAQTADTSAFDASTQFDLMGWQISVTNEALLQGDWAKGPAGTGETDWTANHQGQTKMLTGWLAEGYELTAPDTIILHIKKGVKWWSKPPANGREFTADDVVWNLKTQWANPGGNFANFFPAPEEKLLSVEALDKYTVELKFTPTKQGIQILESGARAYMMLPELYPNQKDWKNALGTGAFMLVDYVSATSMTFKKNPNYHGTDPAGPGKGNQLPYIDELRFPVIPDLSTQQAAFRTGKIDVLGNQSPEDFEEMQSHTGGKFEYKQAYGFFNLPTGRQDKDLPFKDIRVRQAMNLAVDKVAIARDFYEGKADVLGYPYNKGPGLKAYYTPLEELPAFVQELVKGGNPEKAKQLLKDAGFPSIKRQIIVQNVPAIIDLISIIKDQWSKVGVELEIQTKDAGTYNSISATNNYEDMIFKVLPVDWNNVVFMSTIYGEGTFNISYIKDPKMDELNREMQKYIFIDNDKIKQLMHDQVPYILEQAWLVPIPSAFQYAVWQPWVKNYVLQGVGLGHGSWMNWPPHVSIDQDLKKSMGF